MLRIHATHKTTPNRVGRGAVTLFTTLLVSWLALTPLVVMAAPAAQFGGLTIPTDNAPTGTTLLLGEYAFVDLLNGESYTAEMVIPEGGSYLITAVDDVAAEDFDLVVTDAAGNELFNDIFATTEITLDAGTITLEFTAVTDSRLGAVVLGQIGSMTEDMAQPGKLTPGSIYINEAVNDTLYATVSIPPSDFPRQVLIALEPGADDIYYAYATGEDVYASATTDSSKILSFWTHGGEYALEVSAYERRSELMLIVFVTGEPTPVTVGETREGSIPAGATEVVYELELDASYANLLLEVESTEALGVTVLDNYYDYDIYYSSYGEDSLEIESLYPGVLYVLVQATESAQEAIPFALNISGEAGRGITTLTSGEPFADEVATGESTLSYAFEIVNPGALVTVSLSGDDPDIDFDLNAGLRPGGNNWASYSYGSEESLTFLAPIAGTYYATVLSNGNSGAFSIQVDEGDPAPTLQPNAVFYDEVEGYSRNIYLLPIDEAGQLLSVMLVGPEDVDLDLTVNGYNSQGDNILSLSGYSSGSAEAVSYLLPEAGLYEIGVNSTYSEQGGYFFIQAQVVDPRFFGGQWAIDATASSQYGDEGYAAQQATGPNDTTAAGDYPTAWAAAEADAGIETLELTFEVPVHPAGIAIFESYNPGAITTIEAFDSESSTWVVIYAGEASAVEEGSRVFTPELTPVDFATNQIRLTQDTAAVPSWNEIDAVQLFGRP